MAGNDSQAEKRGTDVKGCREDLMTYSIRYK